MEIYPGIQIRDLGLYIVKEKTLIISDIHIGWEEALNKQGIMIPRVQFWDLIKRVTKMLDDVDTVVINGDLKHEFGTISQTEWRHTREFLDLFGKRKVVLIQGNHDTILKPIVKDMELKQFYKIGDVLICHGDEILNEKCKVIIMGHEHTAVGIKEGSRIEKYKCFMKGKYKDAVLISMPSCNTLTEGTDVTRNSRLSPYLQQDLKNFEVYIVTDTVYDFGKVKDLPR